MFYSILIFLFTNKVNVTLIVFEVDGSMKYCNFNSRFYIILILTIVNMMIQYESVYDELIIYIATRLLKFHHKFS